MRTLLKIATGFSQRQSAEKRTAREQKLRQSECQVSPERTARMERKAVVLQNWRLASLERREKAKHAAIGSESASELVAYLHKKPVDVNNPPRQFLDSFALQDGLPPITDKMAAQFKTGKRELTPTGVDS